MKENTPSPATPILTLTERLAAERTDLANERTLLAYARTALALMATGAGFGQYLDLPVLRIAFLLLLPVGVGVLVIGLNRYRQRRSRLRQYRV